MLPEARHPCMNPFMPRLRLCYSHQDQVVALASGVTRVAANDHSENDALLVRNPLTKQPKVFSFQAHVEYPCSAMHSSYSRLLAAIDSVEHGRAARAPSSLTKALTAELCATNQGQVSAVTVDFLCSLFPTCLPLLVFYDSLAAVSDGPRARRTSS